MFWVEPKQRTHWEMVEAIVWHTTPEMRDKKCLMYYWMTLYACNVLVEELTLFLKSKCFNLVRPHLEVRKTIVIVLYRFAHGLSPKHMLHIFDVGASTLHKYVDIVCVLLCNKDKLFDKYIKTPNQRPLTAHHTTIWKPYKFAKHMWCYRWHTYSISWKAK